MYIFFVTEPLPPVTASVNAINTTAIRVAWTPDSNSVQVRC